MCLGGFDGTIFFFRDAWHHSIWTLLAVGRRDPYTDMVLSDSMGFSFPSRWCSVGWSYDRGTRMTQWTELDLSVWVCVCAHVRAPVGEPWMTTAFFTEDGSRRLWSIACNQPPPTALTATDWSVDELLNRSIGHISAANAVQQPQPACLKRPAALVKVFKVTRLDRMQITFFL